MSLILGLEIDFIFVGSFFPHILSIDSLLPILKILGRNFQFLDFFFFLKNIFQEYSHIL